MGSETRDTEIDELNSVFGSVRGFGVLATSKMSQEMYNALCSTLREQKISVKYRRISPEKQPVPVSVARQEASGYFGPDFGTVILSFSIASFTMLGAGFFGEAGKDAYVWLKSKLAIEKARSYGPFYIDYRFTIDKITIRDGPKPSLTPRHDAFFQAILQLEKKLSNEEKASRLDVELEFDDDTGVYLKGIVLKDDGGYLKIPMREIFFDTDWENKGDR